MNHIKTMKINVIKKLNKQYAIFGLLWGVLFSCSSLANEDLAKFNQHNSQFKTLFQCNKSFRYNIFLGGIKAGSLQRKIIWQNNTAIIHAQGNVKILGIGSTYTQTSNLHWSEKNKHFYTDNFTQIIKGLDSRNMTAKITNNGTSSDVILDNEKSQYSTKKYPLYDLDTLGEQLRLELIKGTKIINLYRQASDQIKHYQFKVIGKETIKVKPWGKIETIRLNEIGDHKGTVLWFSPSNNYQLLKAKIDAFITPVITLTAFNSECEQKNILDNY
ncbi:MAG: DUF3108 domain-containing protein [Alteromonadaceae bacterium]|nr:DUF3108 domain-containing protein [Alteromonadaceae bacterium]